MLSESTNLRLVPAVVLLDVGCEEEFGLIAGVVPLVGESDRERASFARRAGRHRPAGRHGGPERVDD